MKNILFVNPTVLVRRPLAQIVEKLSVDDDYSISVITPRKVFSKLDDNWHTADSLSGAEVVSFGSIGLPVVKSEWPIPFSFDFFKIFSLMRKADVIHMWTNAYLANFIVLILNIFYQRKLILTMDTVPGYSFKSGALMDLAFRIYYFIFRWIVFRVPDVITLYGDSLKLYLLDFGVNEDKIKVISSGIDVNVSNNYKDVSKEFGISKNDFVFGYVGLLIDRKGIDLIIKLADKFKDNSKVKFLLVGDGPNRKGYEDEILRLGLSNVIITGFRKDVHNFYKLIDVFLLASRGEGLPGVVMEAMTHSIPVVASRIPCVPDLVVDGKTGVLFEMDNFDDFFLKAEMLFNDSKLRARLGKAGLLKIKEFDWNVILKKYVTVYENLVSKD